MKLARRPERRVATRAKTLRRLAVKDQFRRGLLAERLEERSLLAADVISGFLASTPSPYHNTNVAVDVTNDLRVTPMDALAVINSLNAHGIRQLPTEVAEGESRQFIDVNNDLRVTPMDALAVINYLNAEGAPPDQDDKVQYIFVAVRPGGDPTNAADILGTIGASGDQTGTISDGQQFDLVMMAKDLRAPGTFIHPIDGEKAKARYVFTAYADVTYDDQKTPVAVTEIQNLAISGVSSGTLTLTDPTLGINVTTGNINFDMSSAGARTTTAAAVEAALNAQLGAGSVSVAVQGTTNLRVSFIGRNLISKDVALMTTTAGTVTVTQFRSGDPNVQASFNSAFTHSPQYANGTFKRDAPNLLDDMGGFASVSPTDAEILDPIEVVRVRMIARLPTGVPSTTTSFTTNFLPLYANMDVGHETSVIGNLGAVPPELPEVLTTEINWNTVSLTIVGGPVNAQPDAATVAEDTAAGILIDVLGNDTLNPGANPPIQLRSVQQPAAGGSVAIEGTSVRFTPAADFAGTATFTYKASVAGSTEEATGTVTVTVTPVNDPPKIDAITNQNIDEDVNTTVNLTGIDAGGGADEDNQTLTVTATSSNPSLIPNPVVTYTSPNATGSLLIAPALNQSGSATITVTVTDNGGGSTTVATRTFTVNVAPVNDLPENRRGGVAITAPVTVVAPGATFAFTGANQLSVFDVEAGTANITTRLNLGSGQGTLDVGTGTGVTVSGDNSGSVTLTGPQAGINEALATLTYLPGAFAGVTATLTVETTDNNSGTTTSTITISRDPGIRPFAVPDDAITDEADAPADVIIPVLANDFTEAGRTNTVTIASPPSVGSATVNANNEIVYRTPGGNFFTPPGQPVTLTYTLDDGVGAPSTSTVSIVIRNVNDAPVGVADTFDAQVGQPNTIALPGVLSNDTDVDGDTLSAVNAVIAAGQGTVTLNSNGSFVYTPPATTGTFTFTYQARDPGGLTSAPTTVTMRVSGPASAVNDTFTATEDTVFTSPTSVLANDDDGDPTQVIPLTATLVSNVPASAGSVALNADGTFTYSPAANFSGSTSFTYTANAGAKVSNVATVTITVTEVNDPPTATNDTFLAVKRSGTAPNEVGVDQPVSVLGNDSIAPDTGETLSVTGIGTSAGGPFSTGPTATTGGGSVRISASGQILYTSPTTAPKTDSFFYQITDSRGGTAVAQVAVDVVDFVPKVISGTVYVDSDNDGVIDAGERRLAGVEVTLSGTDFTDAAVNVTVTTDINGNYTFGGAGSNITIKPPKPGTSYTLTETNPLYLLSGLDTNLSTDTYDHDGNSATAEVPSVTNSSRTDSRFHLTWNVTDSGNITGLNFGERGVDVSSLSDASGFLQEYLASSSGNGFVMAADLGGEVLWNWSLPGWENAKTISARLSSDLTILQIECVDGQGHTHTTSLTQNPSNGTMARFRILGVGQNGQYIIRVDGTSIESGLDLHAALPAGAGGEGEAAAFAAGADAFFAEQAMA